MNTFLPLNINTLIIAMCAIGLFIQQWRSGSSKVSSETIIAYQAQATVNEKTLANNATEINTLNGKVGKLEGIIQEKDKQLSDYKEIFQGRNPQLEEILNQIVSFMKKIDAKVDSIDAKTIGGPSITTTTVKQ